jgi:hypothetical protein
MFLRKSLQQVRTLQQHGKQDRRDRYAENEWRVTKQSADDEWAAIQKRIADEEAAEHGYRITWR